MKKLELSLFTSALVVTFALVSSSALADGESLAETGGYVPTESLGIESFSITLQ